jgi:hypothetical protein
VRDVSNTPRYDKMLAAVAECHEHVLANIDSMTLDEAARLVSMKPERMLYEIRLRADRALREHARTERTVP